MNNKQDFILSIRLKQVRLSSGKNVQLMVENIFQSVITEEQKSSNADNLGTKLKFQVTGVVPQIKSIEKIPFIDGVYKVNKQQSKVMRFTANKKSTMTILLVHNNKIQKISFKLNNFLEMPKIQHQITAQFLSGEGMVDPINMLLQKKMQNEIQLDFVLVSIPSPFGTLNLIIVQAQLTQKSLFRIDPYVKIRYRDRVQYTKAKINANLNPIWNHQFLFEVQEIGDQIVLEVWDQNIISNTSIGQSVLSVLDLGLLQQSSKYQIATKQLFKGSKRVGLLKYEYKFEINCPYNIEQD